MLLPNSNVAVLGSGISGLSYAYFLTRLRPDLRIDIYESKATSGGWINSQKVIVNQKPIILEKGPRTLRGAGDGTLLIIDILRQLGLSSQIEVLPKTSKANQKYLMNAEKRLVKVPDDFKSAVNFFANTSLITGELILGMAKEPWVKALTTDESVEDFFSRRFGSKVLPNQVLSAVLHGIYAGDISKLSVKSILPSLVELEKESGSILRAVLLKVSSSKKEKALNPILKQYEELISPKADLLALSNELKAYPMIKLKDGLQILPLAIENYLKGKVNIIYNAKIDSISPTGHLEMNGQTRKYAHIRSTINSNSLAKLLDYELPGLDLEYVSILLVNVFVPKKINLIPKGKEGFGFLVPKLSEQLNRDGLLGVIYDSDVEMNVQQLVKVESANELLDRAQGLVDTARGHLVNATNFDDTQELIDSAQELLDTASSSLVSENDRDYEKITLMMGGHHFNKTIPSSSVSTKMIKNTLREYLHVDLEKHNLRFITDEKEVDLNENDILVSASFIENCIPQYHVGYNEAKENVLDELSSLNISLGGMAFGLGVGVPDVVLLAFEGAANIAE